MLRATRWALPLRAALLCAAALAFVAGSGDAVALTNCDTDSAGVSAAELQMFNLMNEARTERGLTPLKLSPGLSRSSAWKSADDSAWGVTPTDPKFSHTDSLGRNSSQRARDCGFPADAAENIAYGWGSAQATFEAWMNSPGHRANILMDYYVTAGVGEVNDRWTVDFGIHDDSVKSIPQVAPTATPTPKPAPPAPPPPTATPTQVGALQTGVNYVRYSGPAQPAAVAFSSLGSNLRFVYWWDAEAEQWRRYIPGTAPFINTLREVRPGQSLVVSVTAGTVWNP